MIRYKQNVVNNINGLYHLTELEPELLPYFRLHLIYHHFILFFDRQEQVVMPLHNKMAGAPQLPAGAHVDMPPWTPKHIYPTLSSSTAGVASSDVKAFDVEVAMANSIIDPNPDARPRQFRSLLQECIFVFTVMMSTASTVGGPEAPSAPC